MRSDHIRPNHTNDVKVHLIEFRLYVRTSVLKSRN